MEGRNLLLVALLLLPATRAARMFRNDEPSCQPSDKLLLTNGYFSSSDLGSIGNVAVAAALATDAYAWSFYIFSLRVGGLTPDEQSRYVAKYKGKWLQMGARDIQFIDHIDNDAELSAHAIVFHTGQDVWLTIRGTSDIAQVMGTFDTSTYSHTFYGQTVPMYQAAIRSIISIYPQIAAAVANAIASTRSPSAAKVYVTGHSLGGASAFVSSLKLKEAGVPIGAVYGFGAYVAGTNCGEGESCWVRLYDQHLGDRTFSWWHANDPIPWAHLDVLKQSGEFPYGLVQRYNSYRTVGDRCMHAVGPLAQACLPELDAADGKADGTCKRLFGEHFMEKYLQVIGTCAINPALLTGVNPAAKLDNCAAYYVRTLLYSY